MSKLWCHTDLSSSPGDEVATLLASQVLITGASSGCGQAMAVGFAHAGASDLFLTARKKENLEQTESQVAEVAPQARVHSYALDIQNEAQVDTVVPDILQVCFMPHVSAGRYTGLTAMLLAGGWQAGLRHQQRRLPGGVEAVCRERSKGVVVHMGGEAGQHADVLHLDSAKGVNCCRSM